MALYSHAGGIVYTHQGGQTRYLIVRAKPDPSHWVIPKGHIETGEDPEETALREIREETGVMARIIEPLGVLRFEYQGNQIATIVYLMEQVGETQPQEDRDLYWGSFEETQKLLTFPDTRELVRQAAKRLPQLVVPPARRG